MSDPFVLTENDKAQPLWRKLEAHLTKMLADARLKNDNEALTEQQTAALRGRIKCLRSLIELGASRPMTGDDE